MSFDIYRFIEEIVKRDLPELAMKNAYFGAGVLAGGVEFFGACLDTDPIAEEGKSAARFCQAINELFPSEYHQFSRPAPYTKALKPAHDLYSCLRCGMAHVLRPQGVLLTGTVAEATDDGNTHLQILTRDGRDYPLIVVEQFMLDFVSAATALEKRLAAAPLPPKLQGNILTVWSS
ncbi:MAG TPA: hypothetical protein PLA50_04545 [Bacteroidia bacterium]|nr:hypothetical protein [Bacteroidia bacterium]